MTPGKAYRDSENSGQAYSGSQEQTRLAKLEGCGFNPQDCSFTLSSFIHSYLQKLFSEYLPSHCMLGYKYGQDSSLPLL